MRHTSERVIGKNYRPLGGRPLFHHIISTLLAVPQIEQVAIDTDSPLIADDAHRAFPDVRIIERPEPLRGAHVAMNDILLHDVDVIDAGLYLQTHSTNPLLTAETITAALDAFDASRGQFDSLFTVTPLYTRLWSPAGEAINHDPAVLIRTQDLPPVMEENSCMYLFDGATLRTRRNRIGAHPLLYPLSPHEAWDIDDEDDWVVVEALYTAAGSSTVSSLRVLITCRQMQNCVEPFRHSFDARDIAIDLPEVMQQPTEDELISMIGDYDGMIAGDDPLTARVLAHADRLRIISKWGVGVDGIDLDAAAARGIAVTNTPDVFGDDVADVAAGYLVMLARQLHRIDASVRNGGWLKHEGVALAGEDIGHRRLRKRGTGTCSTRPRLRDDRDRE